MISKTDFQTFIKWWQALASLSHTDLLRLVVVWLVLAVIVCLPFYPSPSWRYFFNPRTAAALLAAVGVVLLIRQRINIVLAFKLLFTPGKLPQSMAKPALDAIQEARDAALCFGGLIAICGIIRALVESDDCLQLPRLFSIAASAAFQGGVLSELLLAPLQKLLGRRAPEYTTSTLPLWRGVYITVVAVGLSLYVWGAITGAFVMGIQRPSYPPISPTAMDKGTLKFCYFIQDGQLVYGGRTPGIDKVLLGDTKRKLLGHQVQSGKNMVLIYRVLEHRRFTVDDVGSAKFTVEIPDFQGAGTYKLPSGSIKAYYTYSAISWGPRAHAVESDAIQGTIKIWDAPRYGSHKDYLTFKVDLDFEKGDHKIKEKGLEFETLPGPIDGDDWINGTRIRPWIWGN